MFGYSVRYAGSLHATAVAYGEPYQFYLGRMNSYYPASVTDDDLVRTRATVGQFYVHCPCVYNLAGEDPQKVSKTFDGLTRLLTVLSSLQASAILHVGSGEMSRLLPNLWEFNRWLQHIPHNKPLLLLENAAGQGRALGVTIEELEYLLATTGANVGLCLDTQHAFAAGICQFKTKEDVDRFLAIGTSSGKRATLVHLNDSAKAYNSRVDRHASLGEGFIWRDSLETLQYLVCSCQERGIDMILETPNQLKDACLVDSLLPTPGFFTPKRLRLAINNLPDMVE